jgi:hypothetical protein
MQSSNMVGNMNVLYFAACHHGRDNLSAQALIVVMSWGQSSACSRLEKSDYSCRDASTRRHGRLDGVVGWMVWW